MKRIQIGLLLCAALLSISFAADHFTIGSEVGPGELIYPNQVQEGPDKNIYVYDEHDAFIKVFSAEGKYLRCMGGKGQGPGEIQRPDGASFGFTADEKFLFFSEFMRGHRWISLVELSGKFHEVIKLQMTKEFGIIASVPLADRRFLSQISYGIPPKGTRDYFLYSSRIALVIIDAQGRVTDHVISKDYVTRISNISHGGDAPIPFIPGFAWVLTKDHTIIFSDGTSKDLLLYNLEGQSLKKIAADLPEPESVSAADLENWRERYRRNIRDKGWFENFGRVVEKYKRSIYDRKPNIAGMSLTPDQNILVTCANYRGEKPNDYRLIDQKGKALARVAIDAFGLEIEKNFIFFKTRDEDDNIVVHCLKRKSGEKEDLLQLNKLLGEL